MVNKNLMAYIRKDAELYKRVLLDAYIRLNHAYNGDQKVVRENLLAAFPDDKKAVEEFLANSGNTIESVHEVRLLQRKSRWSKLHGTPHSVVS